MTETEAFALLVKAVSPDDPTGHVPNCGYTFENETCDCAAFGQRLHAAVRTIHQECKESP